MSFHDPFLVALAVVPWLPFIAVPYRRCFGLELRMNAKEIPSGLDVCSSEPAKANIRLGIPSSSNKEARRLGTYENQEKKNDSRNYRRCQKSSPAISYKENANEPQEYATIFSLVMQPLMPDIRTYNASKSCHIINTRPRCLSGAASAANTGAIEALEPICLGFHRVRSPYDIGK